MEQCDRSFKKRWDSQGGAINQLYSISKSDFRGSGTGDGSFKHRPESNKTFAQVRVCVSVCLSLY